MAVCILYKQQQIMGCYQIIHYLSSCCGFGHELSWSWRALICPSSLTRYIAIDRTNSHLLSHFSILSGLGAAARSNSSCLIFASRLITQLQLLIMSSPYSSNSSVLGARCSSLSNCWHWLLVLSMIMYNNLTDDNRWTFAILLISSVTHPSIVVPLSLACRHGVNDSWQ